MKIILPKEYIKKLTRDIMITRGLDNCLWLFSSKEWQRLFDGLDDLIKNKRDLARFVALMRSGVAKARVGKDGKISIPSYLKDYAYIRKDVLFLGFPNKVELWAKEEFEQYKNLHRQEFEACIHGRKRV